MTSDYFNAQTFLKMCIRDRFGYDHMEDGERLVMEEKQKEILETRGYTR